MAEESVYLNKKFGYNEVKWVIKNHCVSLEDETNKQFSSPEFYVKGLHLTKWRIVMRRSSSEIDQDGVYFCLQRLKCNSYDDPVLVDCIVEYNDHYDQLIEEEFKNVFGVNLVNIQECVLMFSAFSRTEANHPNDFHLTVHILVHFDEVQENIPICQDKGLRSLSGDILQLYEDGILSDMKAQFGSKDHPTTLHKAILFFRIGNKDFKKRISSAISSMDLHEFHYEAAEKVCKFLYSGDMNYPVTYPSISVYRFAKVFDVKPVVAYYEPEKFLFTSAVEIEEFYTKWTIDNFTKRDEVYLLSPLMINGLMDTRWRLLIYPKGLGKNKADVHVYLKIETESLKHICAKIFVVNEVERVSHCFHKSVLGSITLAVKDLIPVGYVANNYHNLTVGLKLCISIGEESCSIDKIVSGDYYFYGQKNYERFSEDILSIYFNDRFSTMSVDFEDHNVTIKFHEGILQERCLTLLHELKNKNLYHFTDIKHLVLFELFIFLYSGKLGPKLSLEETFSLYKLAKTFNFLSLKTVITEKLTKLISKSNATNILEFAVSEGIESLKCTVQTSIRNNSDQAAA